MKIDHIDCISSLFEYPNRAGFRYAGGVCTGRLTSLIRVHTDSGEVGIGAAYSHSALVLVEPLTVKDGHLHLSRAPGLGIELNQKTIDGYCIQDPGKIADGAYSCMAFGKEYGGLAGAFQEKQ